MNKRMKIVFTIVFFGSLWGLLEATLGAVLHMVPIPFIAGTIMFPIAASLLVIASDKLKSFHALFAVGLLAALIKSVNFFTPMNQWGVINPMIAIVIESLLIVGFVSYLKHHQWQKQLSAFVLVSVVWRALYLTWFAIQYLTTGFMAAQITDVSAIMSFVGLQGLVSGVMAFGLVRFMQTLHLEVTIPKRVHHLLTSGLFVLALMLTYIL